MKRYKPLIGVFGLAAIVGLYTTVNRTSLYKGPETEEFLEEETEPEVESPEEEMQEAPLPYHPPKVKREEKNIPRPQPNSLKYDQKQKRSQHQLPKNPFPLPQRLDDFVQEEAEEKPSYDLSTEEREKLTVQQLLMYGGLALQNLDYKVAETYSSDLKKRYGNEKYLFDECHISEAYDRDLTDMVENCKKYDYDSVFRKVMWMNIFFIPKYEQNILDCKIDVSGDGSTYIKRLDQVSLVQKGNQALEAIEYCHE